MCDCITEDDIVFYPPSREDVLKWVKESGLSSKSVYNSIKRGKELKLNINSFEEIKKATEEDYVILANRVALNMTLEQGFKKEILRALTSIEDLLGRVEETDAADDYLNWLKMGMNIKYFHPDEKGLQLFKTFSAFSSKYDEKETEKFWAGLKPEYGNMGTIVNILSSKKSFFEIPKNRKEYLRNG